MIIQNYSMVGLKSKLKQLSSQKSELSKIRRKGENEYKKVRSISKKYSSSLKSTQKRIQTFKPLSYTHLTLPTILLV